MTTLEDRLRAATRAAADLVPEGAMTPLSLPATRFRWTAPAARRRLVAFAAPLAAATAVAAVLIATVVARTDAGGTSQNTGGASGQALHLPPRHFVALTGIGPLKINAIQRTEAVVASTLTGHRIATIRPPAPYYSFAAVTGTADGRSYVLAAKDKTRAGSERVAIKFFELRIGGRSARLSALPIPLMHSLANFNIALSPDGTRLAVTGTWPKGAGWLSAQTGLRIYNLSTGKLDHFWQVLPPPAGHCCGFQPQAWSPSWESGSRFVALEVNFAHCLDCVALLNISNLAPSVQAAAKVIVRTQSGHFQLIGSKTLITPDGIKVLRSAEVVKRTGPGRLRSRTHVFTINASTGKTSSDRSGPAGFFWTLAWTSPSGSAYIVTARAISQPHDARYVTAAIFRHGYWTGITLPAKTLSAAW